MTRQISIVRDFHPFPAGRYVGDGEGNGTSFREKYLIPSIERGEELEVDLDGAPGYPSSFLEEAFGGLIRHNVTVEVIRKYLRFHASDGYERYIARIWGFIEQAANERQQLAADT